MILPADFTDGQRELTAAHEERLYAVLSRPLTERERDVANLFARLEHAAALKKVVGTAIWERQWSMADDFLKEELDRFRLPADGLRQWRLQNGSGVTAEQWEALKALYDDRCAYCHQRVRVLEQDHVVPLARGGEHAVFNIVPACRDCNARKSAALTSTIPARRLLF